MKHNRQTILAKTKQFIRYSSLALGIFFVLDGSAFAAKVPEGTILADKQHIAIQMTADVASFDPQKIYGTGDSLLATQLFEGLVNTDENDEIIPGVAERWEYANNAQQVTFYLRENAKWSNGDPVTAHDFVYAWQRLVDPKTASNYASYLSFMNLENTEEIISGKKPPEMLGVKALDDFTLQLTLTKPVPYAVDLTQHSSLFPTHRATIEKYGDNWTRPQHFVGNGAYQLDGRVLNEKVTLKRNPHYWNDKESVIDEVTFYVLNESAAIARYRTGSLDISYIPSNLYRDAKFLKQYGPQIHHSRKLGTFTYEMNMATPPFDDIRVRKALDLSIDREIITKKILGFGQIPTFTFTPNYIHGGEQIKQPEYANWTQAQRNAQAKTLLAEAGYSKANPLKAELLYSTNEGLKELAIAATSMWKKNTDGMVEIKLKNMEWKTFLDTKNQKDYQIAFAGWIADYNEASTFLTYYLSTSEQNINGFNSATFDQFIQRSYYAETKEERANIYAQAEAELNRHHPFVAIYHYAGQFIKNPKLKGYEGKSAKGNYFIKDLYLEK